MISRSVTSPETEAVVVSTSGATPVNKMGNCDAGMLLVTDLKPGPYMFNATLTGGAMQTGINASVAVGVVTTADPIDFATVQAVHGVIPVMVA